MNKVRVGGFTPEQAARTWEATQAYERALGASAPNFDYLPGVDGIFFRNESGEEIPAYGLMHITRCVDDKFNYVTVDKPATTNAIRSKILINGPVAVPNGKEGTAQSGPIFRLIHDNAISYQAGDRVGYKNGSFLAGLNPTFLVLGGDDIEENCLRVMFDDTTIFGVTADTLTSSLAGNVTVISPFAPVTRTHKAKTLGASLTTGVNVKLFTSMGEWYAMEYC